MLRHSCSLLLLVVLAGACKSSDTRPAVSDCLGGESPQIALGKVGDLDLTLTLRELKARCPQIRDTFAHGDESRDTAIVISRPDLSVVGRVANIANDEGSRPYSVDSSRRVHFWTVTGTGATLPGGVPLSAPWDALVRAFGKPIADPLNGDVYVWFCEKLPDYVLHFDDPVYRLKEGSRDSFPDVLRNSRIRSVDFPTQPDTISTFRICARPK